MGACKILARDGMKLQAFRAQCGAGMNFYSDPKLSGMNFYSDPKLLGKRGRRGKLARSFSVQVLVMAKAAVSAVADASDEEIGAVERLVRQARAAMAEITGADQARVDEIVTAVAWSLYKPENAKMLADLSVRDTGIGNVDD